MMDEKQLAEYRRMTPAERFEIWAQVSELCMALWEANLDEAEIARRWAIWRRDHDLSDENRLRCFREAE